jgi:hypothetical protein
MCLTSLDICFTYVWTGWEGSARDSCIFAECISDPRMHFPTPVEGIITTMIMCFLYATRYSETISKFIGYFYLVDSGCGCYKGFLPLYRNERYNLDNFRGSWGKPRTVQEVFNYKHFSLQSAVERTFDIMNNRFLILNNMPLTRSCTNATLWLHVAPFTILFARTVETLIHYLKRL